MKNALNFLIHLKLNNERNWFKENEKFYQSAKTEFTDFIDSLIPVLKSIDDTIDVESSKECLFRIYRDVRFSKNKEPYKTNFGAFIAKGGRKTVNAGYYIHFEPDQSFIGGGIYMPQPNYLKAIRTNIYNDPDSFKKILNEKKFKDLFGGIEGEKLKTAPKGFPKDFPDLDLIKNKHFVVSKKVSNEFWLSGDLVQKVADIFKEQYPLNSYLNKIAEKV
jgi:uncharacterized protein (TIGR02453 family)